MQGPADLAGLAGGAAPEGDVAVGGNPAVRDEAHSGVDPVRKAPDTTPPRPAMDAMPSFAPMPL